MASLIDWLQSTCSLFLFSDLAWKNVYHNHIMIYEEKIYFPGLYGLLEFALWNPKLQVWWYW